MSKNIDERIVEMKFNNGQFQTGVKKTLDSLSELTKGLKFDNAKSGIGDVGSGVGALSGKFSALSVAGVTALATIASKAVTVGLQVAKSLTIDPIAQGYGEYELKMGSIQTIMAGTGETLETVNKKLADLNTYSDRTIYSFADMTQNIGKFTNAGVDLDKSVASIQGVSNVAALSGANANEASRAMYNFAQALSKGHVQLIDWKSIELANMGTVEFKQQLIDAGVAMGTLTDAGNGMYKTLSGSTLSATKGFNEALNDQWLTTDVLTGTLTKYADETTDIGKRAFAAAQDIKTFSQWMDTLKEAVGSGWAQSFELIFGDFEEAKALWTGLNDVISGFISDNADARNEMLKSWDALGGREAMVQGLYNILAAIKSIVDPIAKAMEQVFPNAKQGEVLANISKGFEKFTKFLILTGDEGEKLRLTFKGIFSVFSIIGTIVTTLGKIIWAVISPLFAGMDRTGGGILAVTANIGLMIAKFDTWLKQTAFVTDSVRVVGEAMTNVSDTVAMLKERFAGTFDTIIEKVTAATTVIKDFFGGAWDSAFGTTTDAMEKMQGRINQMAEGPMKDLQQAQQDMWVAGAAGGNRFRKALSTVTDAMKTFGGYVKEQTPELLTKGWNGLKAAASGLASALGKIMAFFTNLRNNTADVGLTVGNAIKSIYENIQKAMSGVDPNIAASSLNLGLFAVGAALVKRIMDNFGVFSIFEEVGDTLSALQLKLKADALIKIAVGIGLLALSVLLLAQIPADQLIAGVAAMAVMGAGLMGLMKWMTVIMKDQGFVKMPVISTALALLGGAMLLLAMAAEKFSKMSIEEVGKALLGLSGALAATNFARGGKVDAIALFALALAFRAMAKGIQELAAVPWDGMAKAGVVMATLLIAMAALNKMKLDGANMIKMSIAIGLLGFAFMILAGAIALMAQIAWGTFFDGLGKIAAALALIALAFSAFPASMLANAAAILIVSHALVILAGAIVLFSKIDLKDFAIGMGMIAVTIAGIGFALRAFGPDAIIGAAAILLVAYALNMLVPVILILGNTPWQVLALGLGAIAAVFLILGIAAYVLAPAVPILIGLAIAIGLLGMAAGLAGAGMLWFATGLGLLVTLGAAGAVAIGKVLGAVATAIPNFVKKLAEGLVMFIKEIAKNAPVIIETITGIILALIESLRVVLPPLVTLILETVENIVTGVLTYLEDNMDMFVEKGANILISLLDGIAEELPGIVDSVANLITEFLDALALELPGIIESGKNLIIAWIEGMGDASADIVTAAGDTLVEFLEAIEEWITNNVQRIVKAGKNIASAIINGVIQGLGLGTALTRVKNAVTGLANKLPGWMRKVLQIESPSKVFAEIGKRSVEGVAVGFDDNSRLAENAAGAVGENAVSALEKSLRALAMVVPDDLDVEPTITPVLDLSKVRGEAGKLDTMFSGKTINVDTSAANAASVAAAVKDTQDAYSAQDVASAAVRDITFVQNNNSPESLSEAEIYRQTRNQLSQAKGALTT